MASSTDLWPNVLVSFPNLAYVSEVFGETGICVKEVISKALRRTLKGIYARFFLAVY